MDLFNFIVYFIVLPLIFKESGNIYLYICFIAILFSHLYKDLIYNEKCYKWPLWTEPIGFIIGILLLTKSKSIIIKTVGVFKIIAHLRQFIYNDNMYYPQIK